MNNAMIWGADGGIGHALVNLLASEGWNTLAIARKPGDLTTVASHVLQADVSKAHSVEQAVLAAGYEVDQINLWIYTVGDITSAPVEEMDPAAWQRILDANLTGAYLATYHSWPLLAPDAHLFFLGAVSERMRLPGLSAYAAAKAGLEAFGESLRKEARKRRVTVVRPGAVDTPLWNKVPFRMPANALSADTVAQRILAAYHERHKGTLDLT